MGQRWICTNGHTLAEAPSRSRCPVCAAEASPLVPVGAAALAAHDFPDTLVPGSLGSTGTGTPSGDAPTLVPSGTNGHSPARPPSETEETLHPPTPLFPPGAPTNARPVSPLTGQQAHYPDAATLVPPSGPASAGGAGPVVLPDYEILEVLGRGGMGVVYKARQKALGRVVALKMILAGQHASQEELRRFQVEAEAVARLQHPNIVAIHDIGTRDGRPYFSLEYCDGGSLQSRLDGSPLPPAHAAGLVRKLAEAVGYAHGKGIIHRDLKPANVLLVETRDTPLERATPKITDFGLAKRIEDDQGHTATEAILGTPTYMAPEQAQGKTKSVGPQADVYALGAILYDLLTGRPPFKGATAMDTIQMVQTAEPVPPVRLQPGIPGDLQTITLKCLEKAPERRYGSAGDLAADLGRFLSGQPILARPVGSWERAWKYVRRNPLASAFIALCFLAPAAVAGVSIGYSFHLAEQKRIADDAKDKAEGESKKARLAEEKAKKALAETEIERDNAKKAKTKAEKAEGRARASEGEALDYLNKAQRAADRLLRVAQTKLRDLGGTEAARRELLAEGMKLTRQFLARRGASLPDRLRAAQAAALVGEMEAQLGQDRAAIGHFDESLSAYDAVLAMSEKHRLDASFQNQAVEVCLLRWSAQEAVEPARAKESLDAALARIGAMPEEIRSDAAT
ncbi:MAG: protein kinase, partial [Gemmataceae bacterium]|nr:protein kinase [Gemmataceae bacterium]